MNERIKQLAEQATDIVETFNPDTGITHHREFFNQEKFAELIVKECIQVSEAHAKNLESQPTDRLLDAYDDGIVNGIYEATETIKQHFGVKE